MEDKKNSKEIYLDREKLAAYSFLLIFSALAAGALGGFGAFYISQKNPDVWGRVIGRKSELAPTVASAEEKIVKVSEESAVVGAVEKVSPAVVSVIVSKDLPIMERYYESPSADPMDPFGFFFDPMPSPKYRQKGTEKKEIGGGTGFLVSADGYIVTNKHVVSEEGAEYTVLFNDGVKKPAKVLARDIANDLAVLKVDGDKYPFANLGDSATLKVGQSVIAIGNSLGEFRNTVSTGVISGLSRSITAGGGGSSEELSGVIQTDASINPGNSGGPLLNIAGQVIGINTAMAQGAENIGFAIPINEVKNAIEGVKKTGKISRPWLGIRYMPVDAKTAKLLKLELDYGVVIISGDDKSKEPAVVPNSPAAKAGLKEGDVILELNGQKINADNELVKMVAKMKAGDEAKLKVWRDGKSLEIKLKLEEVKE